MLQRSNPEFKVIDSLHSLKHFSHQSETTHTLIPHQVHSTKSTPEAMENQNTAFLLGERFEQLFVLMIKRSFYLLSVTECESTLDAVISEEVSTTEWKSRFSAFSRSE